MATLAPLSTPLRQPFGVLNDSKLRSLQSIKNRQNAVTPTSAPNLKRRAPSPELSDTENVDPNILDSFGKRKRVALDEDVSLSKPSKYNLHILPSTVKPRITPSATLTPRLDAVQRPIATTTPSSAPPAAGRSPTKGKKLGLMQPRKRFAPPSFGIKSPSLSITAALNGTLKHKKTKKVKTIEESKPKSWFFDIFEESDEQQNYRMNEWTMTQSAYGLDISDDEGKTHEKSDKGKENVDPNDIFNSTGPVTRSASAAATATSTSRKDAMLDEPRTPLGDLNPAEFYAEGLDATSVVLVHEEQEQQTRTESSPLSHEPEHAHEHEHIESQPHHATAASSADFTFEAVSKLPSNPIAVDNNDIHAILESSRPTWEALQPAVLSTDDGAGLLESGSGPIEIWESESAKGDDDVDQTENVDAGSVSKFEFGEANGFALQEL